MTPLSILDLAPIVEGATPADALRNSLDLARHAERLGYTRFWLAEHHNMLGIASAATSVVDRPRRGRHATIRVGAGGIMLPNHSPLVIAEQFGTLESLYPGRIDLGLGRAPGTDQLTLRALRRDCSDADDSFRRTCSSCRRCSARCEPGQHVAGGAGRRHEGAAVDPRLEPLRRAARGGARPAVRVRLALRAGRSCYRRCEVYRARFKPSTQLAAALRHGRRQRHRRRHRRARRGACSPRAQQAFTNMLRGRAASCSRRSTTSRPTGRRRRRRRRRACCAMRVRRLAGDGRAGLDGVRRATPARTR